MGLAKTLWMEAIERGYDYIDKYVCSKCFHIDKSVQAFIYNNATQYLCDYCGKKSKKKPIAAPLEKVIGLIVEGIKTEWGDPNNEGVGWCSAEGGWVGASVIDTYDLLINEFGFGDLHDNLFKDILNTINCEQWCQIDPYSLSPHDQLYYDWERFSEQVKYHTRYVFYRIKEKKSNFEFEEKSEPHKILDYIGSIIKEFGLIRTLSIGSIFVRARVHGKDDKYSSVEELGPPPREKSISTRMSPVGIPIFYGSTDEKIAIVETYNNDAKSNSLATVATFKTLKKFKVLDLTKLPEVPSIFDECNRHLRTPLIFLHSFLRDVTRPIKKDGREHIEYVPTQIVSEYFRYVFRDSKKAPIKGIIYPSSIVNRGASCALFFENDNVVQDGNFDGNPDNKWLTMLTKTICRVNLRKMKL